MSGDFAALLLILTISEDPQIPGASYGFATLNKAQYLGDFESLENHGRRLLRVHLHGDTDTAITVLRQSLVEAL
jgi:transaldolase/glucose-6-phosphate isomerase